MGLFTFESRVLRLKQSHGWCYIDVPDSIIGSLKSAGLRGLIQIVATVDNFEWETAILPLGRGKYFIPIKQLVRRELDIREGDLILISFTLRGL
jgi:hypothetical protein